METKMGFLGFGGKMWLKWWEKILGSSCKIHKHYYQCIGSMKVRRTLWRKLLLIWVLIWSIVSLWIFCCMSLQATEKRKETLASMCDERARMLQDQFNVSMNHVQAMSILISTFHHAKTPLPLTRVLHSEREQFEKQQGWTIKRMDTLEQNPVHKDEYAPEALEDIPHQEEYGSCPSLHRKQFHMSYLLMCFLERLLKTNRLGVILTFAGLQERSSINATPNERVQATDGYLGDGFYHVSSLNFGDPFRKHEMHCSNSCNISSLEFFYLELSVQAEPPWPWLAITTSFGILVIALLVGHIFHATVNRIAKVEDDYHEMMELKKRAEAADVAKSQFLATVSHEIRTPMNGVLGMLNMLMDTDLDVTQQEYVRTAQGSGKALVSIINEVLDLAKIEAGKLELEAVLFDIRAILDDVLSLFFEKSQGKGVELAVYVSDQVPQQLIGDPGRFRQIITNLMGNSIKFTDKGHIFVTVHLVEEVVHSIEVETTESTESTDTLSGFPVADGRLSWKGFRAFSQEGPLGSFSSSSNDLINLIVSVEDTGEGIPEEAQSKIFTPFMQVGPSISRKHGGTGIGLSISKCLVSLMNGEIGFVSRPKIGSTFTFTAVFTNACPNSSEFKSQQINNQSHPASSEFQGMTALVIDPRPVRAKVSRYHIQRLGIHVELVSDLSQAGALKKYGADVVCVSSGKDAISLLKPPHEFDACFMDIQMPEMDGFEATRAIREIEQNVNREVSVEAFENNPNWHLPILAMTADVIQATHEECLKCGMDGYVSKPFEAEQLYREVSRFFQ
ncbi:Signal transduction response regulator, receiver domain [Sesbania bispinosa]|nr:Signal transduction response regulator, receiver domain [Sesbania bispinosa]